MFGIVMQDKFPRLFIWLLLLFIWQGSWAQLDKLIHEYHNTNDPNVRYFILDSLINPEFSTQYESTIEALFEESEMKSKNSKYQHTLGMLHLIRAQQFRKNGDTDNARTFIQQGLTIEHNHPSPDPLILSLLYDNEIFTHQINDDYMELAISGMLKALHFAEVAEVPQLKANQYSNLCWAFAELGDNVKALSYAEKGYALSKELGNPRNTLHTQYIALSILVKLKRYKEAKDLLSSMEIEKANEGLQLTINHEATILEIALQNFSKAAEYIEQSKLIANKTNNNYRLAEAMISEARLKHAQQEFEGSKAILLEILETTKKEKWSIMEFRTKYLLHQVYDSLNDQNKGREQLEQGFQFALEKNNTLYKYKFAEALSLKYEQLGNAEKALKFGKIVREEDAKKSEKILEVDAVVSTALMELDVLEKQKKQLDLENELLNERVSNQRKNILLGLLTFLAILLGGWLYIRNRNQQTRIKLEAQSAQLAKKDKDTMEAELQALRSQLNPHFMFNSLNSINHFIQQKEPDEASEYLVKFSRLMRLILNHSRENLISLEEELEALHMYIELEGLRFQGSFHYQILVDPKIDEQSTYVPSMLTQPYIENAIWHGLLPKKGQKNLLVSYRLMPENVMQIQITDNGIGREASQKKRLGKLLYRSKSMNMNAKRLALFEEIFGDKANVEIEDISENDIPEGTRVTLILPVIRSKKGKLE